MADPDIDRGAPVVVHLQRRIAAPPARLWALHTDVGRWPQWQADIRTATIDGPFAPGATITWTTEGIDEPVPSTIRVVVDGVSTLWGGPAMGITGEHRWTFAPDGAGTLVTTDESWAGAPIEADVPQARRMLEQSLTRWLDAMQAAVGDA